jgi:hypothetical protein
MSREAQTSEHETALASLSAAKKAMCAKRNACEAELVRLDAEIAKFSDKKRELEREHKRRWSEIELQSHQLVKRLKAMGEGEEEVQYGCEGKDKGKDKGDRQGTVGRLSAMAEGMAEIMRRTKK